MFFSFFAPPSSSLRSWTQLTSMSAATTLQQAETRRLLLDPARVLQRGFAIIRGQGGRIAPSASQISKDQSLRLQFRDGHADVTVDEVEKDPS